MAKPLIKQRYIAQNIDMIRSPAYESLSGNAVKLMTLMQTQWRQHEPIAYSVSEAQKKIGCCRGNAHKAFKELESRGFIKLILDAHFHKQLARRWRITFRDYNDQKPTDDWRKWVAEN